MPAMHVLLLLSTTTYKITTYMLKMAIYLNPNVVADGTNVTKVTFLSEGRQEGYNWAGLFFALWLWWICFSDGRWQESASENTAWYCCFWLLHPVISVAIFKRKWYRLFGSSVGYGHEDFAGAHKWLLACVQHCQLRPLHLCWEMALQEVTSGLKFCCRPSSPPKK